MCNEFGAEVRDFMISLKYLKTNKHELKQKITIPNEMQLSESKQDELC